MLRKINDETIVSARAMEQLYPNCRILMTNTYEESGELYGYLRAVSTDEGTFHDMCRCMNNYADIGMPYIGGSYGTPALLHGMIRFDKEHPNS